MATDLTTPEGQLAYAIKDFLHVQLRHYQQVTGKFPSHIAIELGELVNVQREDLPKIDVVVRP